MIMLATGPAATAPAYANMRHMIDVLFRLLVVPSTVLCVLSGFASMLVHRPYWNALWAWFKGATTMFILALTFRGQGQALSVTTPEVVADPAELAEVLRRERSGLWALLLLALINVVIGVWRPRFRSLGVRPSR